MECIAVFSSSIVALDVIGGVVFALCEDGTLHSIRRPEGRAA